MIIDRFNNNPVHQINAIRYFTHKAKDAVRKERLRPLALHQPHQDDKGTQTGISKEINLKVGRQGIIRRAKAGQPLDMPNGEKSKTNDKNPIAIAVPEREPKRIACEIAKMSANQNAQYEMHKKGVHYSGHQQHCQYKIR